MNFWIHYLAIGGVATTAFCAIAYWLFRGNTHYRAKRIYYIVAIGSILFMPLIGANMPRIMDLWISSEMPTVSIEPAEPPIVVMDPNDLRDRSLLERIDISLGIIVIWLTGLAVMSIRLLLSFINLRRQLRGAYRVPVAGTQVYILPAAEAPFSFFGRMYLPATLRGEKMIANVLQHEAEHIRGVHSLDLLLAECVVLIEWWNPFAWALHRLLRNNLECLADEAVLRAGADHRQYQYDLLHIAADVTAGPLCSTYTINNLKERIQMMNKERSKRISIIRYAAAIPVAALTLIVANGLMAESTNHMPTYDVDPSSKQLLKTVESSTTWPNTETVMYSSDTLGTFTIVEQMPEFPGGQKALLAYLSKETKYPKDAARQGIEGKVILQFVVEKDGRIGDIKVLQSLHPSLDAEAIRVVKAMPRWKPGKQKGKVVRTKFALPLVFKTSKPETKSDAETTEQTSTATSDREIEDEQIFTIVEQMPEFPGGQKALLAYLSKEIRYPKDAARQGIEGKVILQFVVEKDGRIGDIKVLQSLHPSLDAEAIRVTKAMPRWEPGKQKGEVVPMKFTLPLVFKIGKPETNATKADLPISKEDL